MEHNIDNKLISTELFIKCMLCECKKNPQKVPSCIIKYENKKHESRLNINKTTKKDLQ